MTNQIDIRSIVRPLIPILKVDRVESTYALRLTPLGKYTFDDIISFLGTFDEYIVVKEESKKLKEHYHAIVFSKLFEEEVRGKIRGFLQTYFTEPPKRGDANKQYNLSEIDNLEQAITYILKDGGDVSMSLGINTEYLDTLKKKSYRKYSKEEFAKALEELKKKFKDEDTSIGDMMTAICQLKGLYRQPINLNQIYQMVLGFYIHNNPHKASSFVSEFLSRLQ